MISQVNYLAVFFAAIFNMFLGGFWFGPLFGKRWVELAGMTPEKIQEAIKKGITTSYILMFVGSLIMAITLDCVLIFANTYFQVSGIVPSLAVGFALWLGFIVPATIGAVLWENRSWMYWWVTNSYYLAGLLMMGILLSSWV